MRKIKLFALIMLVVIAISSITAFADEPQQAITFTDISADAPYKDAVYKLVENGVLNGYPDGSFKPEGNLTRAEMCKMINLTFGYTDTEGATGFPDLVENEWYVPYVLAAQKAGYVEGDDVGTFRPDDNISREEVCAILYRIIKPYDLPMSVTITDSVSEWAKPYVEAMVENHLMPIEDGNKFRATEPIKRHELATAVAPHSNIKIDDIKCKVTFMNGETAEQVLDVSIGKGISEFPTVKSIPAGHKFAGWSKAADEPVLVDSKSIFVQNTTLYAYFDKLEYSVKFIIDSTTAVSETKVKYTEFAIKPVDPKKNGYTFKGWSLNGTNLVDVATYPITADTVFTAVFEKQADVGAGSSSVGGGSVGGTGGTTKPPKPSTPVVPDDGDDDNTGDNTGGNSGNTGDDNTGDDNTGDDNTGDDNTGGNGGNDGDGDDNTGDNEGGNTGGSGNDNPGDGEEDDEEVIISYRVTFVVNGKSYGEVQVIEKGEYAEVPEEPVVDSYTFLYWALEEDGEKVDIRFHEIFEDTEFYAVFVIEESNPNDPAIIEALKKASKQFKAMRLSEPKQKEIRVLVTDTIEMVLEDAENGEYIDSDYVKENYKENLLKVKKLLNSDMTKNEKSEFISKVSNSVDDETFNILADFFLSEETKEDYLG